MTDLKPCHVCGGKPRISGCVLINGKHWNMVSCSAEDHTVQVNVAGETADKARALAIEKWNTRHYPAEVQQAVERMKPEKVIERWSQHGIEYGDCPACICPVERKPWDDHQHCDRCGQALDWSDE